MPYTCMSTQRWIGCEAYQIGMKHTKHGPAFVCWLQGCLEVFHLQHTEDVSAAISGL